MNPLPFTDPPGMAIWLLGFLAVNLLPGHLLVGRHLRELDLPTRLYCSIAAGMCMVTLVGLLLTVSRIPFNPLTTALLVAGAWFASHRSTRWRETLAGLSASIPRSSALHNLLVLAAMLVLTVLMQVSFRDYPASPHLHDASNHAFLVKRIAETGSMAMGALFGEPYALPRHDYLAGWHASAALVSSRTGVKPFIGAWYFATACAALLPLALMLAWRILGARPLVAALACLVAASNYYTPTNAFSWGGYGQIVGLFIVPWVVLLARESLRGDRFLVAVPAGLGLVALLHIHGSEVYLAVVLTLVALAGRGPGPGWRRALVRAGVLAGIFVLLGMAPIWLASYQFAVSETAPAPATSRALAETWKLVLNFMVGNTPRMQTLAIPVLLFGLLSPTLRRFAVAALAVLALYFARETFADPVSLALTRPLYYHSARLAHWFVFFVPVLYAGAAVFAVDLLKSVLYLYPLPRRLVLAAAWTIPLLLVWTHLWPGVYWSYRPLSAKQPVIVFSKDDARLADRMEDELPATAVVANQNDDGSYWFMHRSGLRFLDPTSWETGVRNGTSWRPRIDRLAESPWPDPARDIEGAGVEYYLVSDTVLLGVEPQVSRAGLRADERFEEFLEGADTSLFRILWDREPAPR